MDKVKTNERLININKKTFISVFVLLFLLIVFSMVLTYVLPKGEYEIINGEVDYKTYIKLEDSKGINIFKGLFSPFINLTTSDGIVIIILCLFLMIIGGTFQIMNDCGGIKVFVNKIIGRFKEHKFLLLSLISLIFMLFGSLLGLFEEMLTLLPIIVILAVSLGYDSFTGFLISIVACGFGFASAITNPFTVLFASNLVGVNVLYKFWYRLIIFAVMYGLLVLYVYTYTRKIKKNPKKSVTYDRDINLQNKIYEEDKVENEKKIFVCYSIFFAIVLSTVILFSSLKALRDYTTVALAVIFLFGGLVCGFIATNHDIKKTFKSFLSGVVSTLPSLIFILMAASIKYILIEGKILPTITYQINNLVGNENPFVVALIILAIVLVLEFFISSSTAKAIFVMSILGVLSVGLSKEMMVLVYVFGDGYTNIIFPTSPVLLIGLSMIDVSYFKWIKKSWLLFLITMGLVVAFIFIAIAVGY